MRDLLSVNAFLRASTALLFFIAVPTALAQEDDWCGASATGPLPVIPPGFQPTGQSTSIPVVFHVITGRDSLGNIVGDISDLRLQAQIDTLNQKFAGNNISFSLLGVGRLENQYWHEELYERNDNAGEHLHVDPYRVMNVYVGGESSSIVGSANVPGPTGNTVGTPGDGMFIKYTVFPDPVSGQSSGKVGVHEVGHYLGLHHTWGAGPDTTCTIDDGFADTGLHNGPDFGCPVNDPPNDCVDPGPDDLPNPIFNYMNYTSDVCKVEFSPDQGGMQQYVRDQLRFELGQNVPMVYDARSAPLTLNDPTFSGQDIYVLPGADITLTGIVTLENGARFTAVGGTDLDGITSLDLRDGSAFDIRGYDPPLALSGYVSVSGGSMLRLGRSTSSQAPYDDYPDTPSLSVGGDITVTGTGSALEVGRRGTLSIGASSKARFADGGTYETWGSTVLSDYAEFVMESGAAPPEIREYADTTFAMGRDAKLVFRNGDFSLSGSLVHRFTVRRSDQNEAWDRITLEGNNISLRRAVIEGGTVGVYVRALGTDLYQVSLTGNATGIETDYNGCAEPECRIQRSEVSIVDSRFEGNTFAGLFLRNADVEIASTSVERSTQYGIYVSNATLRPLTDNLITGTGYDETGTPIPRAAGDGVWVGADGDLYLYDPFQISGLNRIADNLGDEIETAPGAYLLVGDAADGDNAVFESGAIPAGTYLIRNVDLSPVLAEHTYWGDASGPPSGAFYKESLIDYKPYLTGDPTGGAGAPLRNSPGGGGAPLASARGGNGGQGEWLRERLRRLRERVAEEPAHPRALRLLRALYRLQRLDRDDILGEHAQTMDLLSELRSMLGESPMPPPLRRAAEHALGAEVADGLRAEDYDATEALLAEYAAYVEEEETHLGLLLSAASVDDQRGRYAEAIGKITEVIAALPPEAEEYAAALEYEVAAIERRMNEDEAGRTAGGSAAHEEPVRSAAPRPNKFALGVAYPNPFDASAVVPVEVGEAAGVRVAVYDLLGREVAVLAEGRREAGRYRARFDANGLASGVYVVRAVMTPEAGGATRVFSQKLTVLR